MLLEFLKNRLFLNKWHLQKTTLIWFIIAALSIGISASMQWSTHYYKFNSTDEWLRDRFIQIQAKHIEEDRIMLIDIDEASIANLGAWPWKRSQIADLIEKLISVYGAKGVALDIFFPNPSDSDGDQRLASLAEFAPLVFAQAFDFNKDRPIAWQFGELSGGTNLSTYAKTHIKPTQFAVATGYIANHSTFRNGKLTGNIGFVPDEDGTLRRIPSFVLYDNKVYPSLAYALFNCCENRDNLSRQHSRLDDVDNEGFSRVHFSKTLSSYKVISASMILQETIPLTWLKDKLVIIGSSSLSLSDRVATPLHSSTSGFLVHAEVLSDLLDGQVRNSYYKASGGLMGILYTLFVVAGGIYMFRQYSALFNTFMLGIASLLWLVVAYILTPHDMWFSPSGPLVANFFLLAVAIPYAWHEAEHRSKHLLETLNQYVAKSVVHELMRSDIKNPLKPRQLHVTTLIADMAGYTTHVENLPIEEAALLTKEFLECLTSPVLEMGGTLDKYTGDGLVAFWGAPLPIENHADRAVDAAIKILNNIKKFNILRQSQGLQAITIRIGIESGIAIAGDFGSSYRSIYTAIGDSVNTASRLEDACRYYPYEIIVGQGTVDYATKNTFIYIEERMLKGKEKSTRLYTVEIPQ